MEQTRAEAPIRPSDAALHPSVPVPRQPAGERAGALAEDRRAAGAAPTGQEHARGEHVRGEHVHSEPPPPAAPPVPPPPPPSRQPSAAAVAGGAAARPRLPRRHSVRAQVLDALREALLAGELAPGAVYSAPALADRFGVSATPVREAMQQLVSEGAVETVPNRGFRIAECSDRDLAELAEIRTLLEVPVVLRAARTVAPERWEELRPLAEETLSAAVHGDPAAYAAADGAFHRAVLERAGNHQLVTVAMDIHRRMQCRPASSPTARGAAELLGAAAEHVALLDALQAQDLPAVERLLHTHVTG